MVDDIAFDVEVGNSGLLASDIAMLDQMITLASVDSTNRYLLDILRKGGQGRICCVSDHQTAGVGRCGSHWESPKATNLYLSLSWPLLLIPQHLPRLSLVVAIALRRMLAQMGLRQVEIKWPNDLLVDGRKIAGILIEPLRLGQQPIMVVIGIGLNVNVSNHGGLSGAFNWTDMASHIGDQDRKRVLVCLLNHLQATLQCFEQGEWSSLLMEWRQHDFLKGRTIELESAGATLHGVVQGVNEDGYLLLKTTMGVQTITSGHILRFS